MSYRVIEAKGHGKAVLGRKKTSTFQVIEPHPSGYLVKSQFRFIVGDPVSRARAWLKAVDKMAKLEARRW